MRPMVRCRTIPRFIELLYAGLCLVTLLAGLFGIVAGVATRFGPALLVGALMVLIRVLNSRELLYRTACELMMDESQALTWKSTLGGGEVAIQQITEIVRAPHRPRVFAFRTADGASTAFWPPSTGPEVRSFVSHLGHSNPRISTGALYGGRGWWRGLADP